MIALRPRDLNSPSPSLSIGVIAGLAVAGLAILLLLTLVTVLIIRARRNHRRLLADLESRGLETSRRPSIAEITDPVQGRTRTVLRRNNGFIPYGRSQAGWGTLDSYENFQVGQPPDYVGASIPPVPPLSTLRINAEPRSASPKTWKWKFMKRTPTSKPSRTKAAPSRLSAITEAFTESPRSQQNDALATLPDPFEEGPADGRLHRSASVEVHCGDDEQQRPDSPLLEIPALPATRPPPLFGRKDAASIRLVQASRSKSLASLPSWENREEPIQSNRPPMHQRSVSLCTQKSGHVPSMPVPPLPEHFTPDERRVSVAPRSPRLSVSSAESAGSSVLVRTPSLEFKRRLSGRLVKGANRDWTTLTISGPRPPQDGSLAEQNLSLRQHPILSTTKSGRRVSACSNASQQSDMRLPSSSSIASSLAAFNRLSAGEIATAESVQLSRVPSAASLKTTLSLSTPGSRRHSRFFVDAKGSPTERTYGTVSTKSSKDAVAAAQDDKMSSHQSSTRNSGFQWDPSPAQLSKPSALKGSPNGRKGHRRQNCVRISLAPTILGPDSRASSPSRTSHFQEGSFDIDGTFGAHSSCGESYRPPSTSAFSPDIRLSSASVRTSLAASSPTLSLINFCQDNGLCLDHLGISSSRSTPVKRNSARLSNFSVASAPSLPDLCEEPFKPVQNPMGPPFPLLQTPKDGDVKAMERSDDDLFEDAPSTPIQDQKSAKPVSLDEDPIAAFLALSSDDSKVSPKDDSKNARGEPPGSSPPVPKPMGSAPHSRPVSMQYSPRSTPPCSPRTRQSFTGSMGKPASIEPAASTGSSGRTTPVTGNGSITPAKRHSTENPSPARSITLQGPRAEPAKTLAKTVQMLRRMNSDVGNEHRAERRYLDMGTRGVSPTLPGGIWRDSYNDFGAAARQPPTPTVVGGDWHGLGISVSDDEYDDDCELDIDEMIRLGASAMGEPQADGDQTLSWLDSDDTNPWDREDSTLFHSPGRSEAASEAATGEGATPSERSLKAVSVWDDGERYWELGGQASPKFTAQSRRSSNARPVPSRTVSSCSVTAEPFRIPGLSLSTPTPAVSPDRFGDNASAEAARDSTEAQGKAAIGGVEVKKARPERTNTLRKSAILNFSLSAHNRLPTTETKGEAGQGAKTSGSNGDAQPGAESSGEKQTARVSWYDEQGFLKMT